MSRSMTTPIVYAPNSRVSKYIKPNMIKCQGEIDKSVIIFRDLNTPFSITNRTNLHLEGKMHTNEPDGKGSCKPSW